MVFTNLYSNFSNGKPIAPSNYDGEFVVATFSKINSTINPNSIINPSDVQLLDNLKPYSNLIEQLAENPMTLKKLN